jgi:hypothetical protein
MEIQKKFEYKQDKYRIDRGGKSRLYRINCEGCEHFLCIYQKDGPGNLRRLYIDRLYKSQIGTRIMATCPSCQRIIGTKIKYAKENRPAIRLYVDSLIKISIN